MLRTHNIDKAITIFVLIAFNRLNQSPHTRFIAIDLHVVVPDLESDSSALSTPTSRSISNHDSLHSFMFSASNDSSSSAINSSASDSSTARSKKKESARAIDLHQRKQRSQRRPRQYNKHAPKQIQDNKFNCNHKRHVIEHVPVLRLLAIQPYANTLIPIRILRPLCSLFLSISSVSEETKNPNCPFFLNQSQISTNYL